MSWEGTRAKYDKIRKLCLKDNFIQMIARKIRKDYKKVVDKGRRSGAEPDVLFTFKSKRPASLSDKGRTTFRSGAEQQRSVPKIAAKIALPM